MYSVFLKSVASRDVKCFNIRNPWPLRLLFCSRLSGAPLSRYPSAGTPRDDGLPCHPHSLWPPRHLSPLPDCPRIPAKGAETWARGELIENQELNDTKKPWEMWEGEKGRGTPPEQDRSGTGCVSARRSSSGGLSYSRESEEEETAGVFEFSPLCDCLVCLLLAGLTDLCLQFPLDTLQRALTLTSPSVSVSRADMRA